MESHEECDGQRHGEAQSSPKLVRLWRWWRVRSAARIALCVPGTAWEHWELPRARSWVRRWRGWRVFDSEVLPVWRVREMYLTAPEVEGFDTFWGSLLAMLGVSASMAARAMIRLSLLRTVVASSTFTRFAPRSASSLPHHALAEFSRQVQAGGAVYFCRVTRFCSGAGGVDELATRKDGSEVDDEKRRRGLNRVLYRSRQRGYLELDLLLGKWTEENITNLDDKRLQELVDLLEGENPDLWNWLTGQAEVPSSLAENSVFTAIKDKITENLTTYSSPQTRAQPGKPWVRGWDDNRKVGGPQVGNQ